METEQTSLKERPDRLLPGPVREDLGMVRDLGYVGPDNRPWSERNVVGTLSTVAAGTRDALDARNAEASGTSDRALTARLVAGDPQALSEIFSQHSAMVLGVCRRVLRDEALAEDVAQEVFVSLWRFPQRFDPSRGSLRSWLGLVAHHRSIDRVRKEKRRTLYEGRSDDRSTSSEDAGLDVTATWLSERVRSALDKLPLDQRKAVVLAYYGDRSYRQVARDLDVPEGTVKSRVRLALRSLDRLLRSELTEPEFESRDQDTKAWTRTPTA